MGGFDLYQGLACCQEHLTLFGGHPMAAGVSLEEGKLSSFRQAFVAAAGAHFVAVPRQVSVEVDAVARLSDIDMVQAEELMRLAPFGNANVEPLIVIPGVVTRSTRVVGTSHLQLTLVHDGTVSDAIAFGMADRDPGKGIRLDVVAQDPLALAPFAEESFLTWNPQGKTGRKTGRKTGKKTGRKTGRKTGKNVTTPPTVTRSLVRACCRRCRNAASFV
jgi:hypothetical protein